VKWRRVKSSDRVEAPVKHGSHRPEEIGEEQEVRLENIRQRLLPGDVQIHQVVWRKVSANPLSRHDERRSHLSVYRRMAVRHFLYTDIGVAQLAVHALGAGPLIEGIGRFGWLAVPAPAHEAGSVDPGEDRYDLGRLGSGLAGSRITPLHAAQLAASLAQGELVTPQWIERVLDARGRELPLPAANRSRVMSLELTRRLREMLTETTRSGTARRAFRGRGGRPLLGDVRVAGKTGSLSGHDPDGRYEWFIGVAPADNPRIAVAAVLVNGKVWYRSASQVAADVLHEIFCEGRSCDVAKAVRMVSHGAADANLAGDAPQTPEPAAPPAAVDQRGSDARGASSSAKTVSSRADRSRTSSPPSAAMSSVSRGSNTRS
jgi:cell division protein FtsI/penicillin-binding protein 2